MKKFDVLDNAKRIAESLGHTFIGTEHVLVAYYAVYNPDLAKALMARMIERIGISAPTNLNLINDRTCAVVNAVKNSHDVDEMILDIITNAYSN